MKTYWAVLGGFKFQIENLSVETLRNHAGCSAVWEEVDGVRGATYHNYGSDRNPDWVRVDN